MSKYAHLSHENLVRLLEARDKRDATRYGLVWEADEIERDAALNSDFVALDLDPALSVGAAPWENLIIEGDNFDALRHLRMCYAGRVKCIYIDPPYNTGNRDFVYNDRFVDANDTWRHSTWCEFMYQRLILAKDLLRQDGVIFVSIDDNEQASLKLLMDRIFGENNFVAQITVQSNPRGRQSDTFIASVHDYILVYAKDVMSCSINGSPLSDEQKKEFLTTDEKGNYRLLGLRQRGSDSRREDRPEMFFPIYVNPEDGKVSLENHNGYEVVFPHKSDGTDGRWMWGKIKCQNEIFRLVSKKILRRGEYDIFVKDYLLKGDNERTRKYKTIWDDKNYNNQIGTRETKELIGNVFSYPKSSNLLVDILRMCTNSDKNDLVLDFFAGSGTTAHAVMKLNAEESGGRGGRRFILVSNTEATADAPDKNLCRDVCAQRVRRVIEGYGDTPGLGGNFAYLRCRRISTENLMGIEHTQVWHALQLLHTGTLATFDDSRGFLWAQEGREAVAYVPCISPSIFTALRAAIRTADTVTLYSWQPGLLRQHIRSHRAHHLPIPEHLALKFGLRK